MRATTGALLAMLPAAALAQGQGVQVPAIAASAADSNAQANALGANASSSAQYVPATSVAGSSATPGPIPPGMPPAVQPFAPSAPLLAKERKAVALSQKWQGRSALPTPGPDGVVRYVFGVGQPTVVCAALQMCDLALQPGEVIGGFQVSDPRWMAGPSTSGSPEGTVTHVVFKPADAGLVGTALIYTNRRTYAVKLVSTQRQTMPLVAFGYADDTQRQWAGYQQSMAFSAASAGGTNPGNLDFGFRVTGDNPRWRPLRVYADGARTYIQFPRSMASGQAPALVGLSGGSWFSSPQQQMLNYRVAGDKFIVDRVVEKAELISGVGGDQTRVLITRDGTP